MSSERDRPDGEPVVAEVTPTAPVMDAASVLVLAQQVDAAFGHGARRVEINLAKVSRISSTVIGILVARERRARQHGGRIVLKNLTPEVARILEILGVHRIFHLQ